MGTKYSLLYNRIANVCFILAVIVGVPGVLWLIQVYDHRRSWWPQSFPFHDQLRPVAMVKPVFPVRSSSSRCMISWFQSFPFHDQLRPLAMAKPAFLVRSASSRCMIAGVPVGLVFPWSVEAGGYGKAGVTGTFFLIQVYDRLVPGGPSLSLSMISWGRWLW